MRQTRGRRVQAIGRPASCSGRVRQLEAERKPDGKPRRENQAEPKERFGDPAALGRPSLHTTDQARERPEVSSRGSP
ncbi:hypothetical protein VTK56DRAFT_5853 [Thermocarpiscus australiensis]